MLFMNDYDIDETIRLLDRRAPNLAPYARFLGAWRDVVNDNSDGWAHWKGGPKAATRLMRLLQEASEVLRGSKPADDMPREPLFKSALTPIRQAATRQGWAGPELQAPAPR